MTLPKHPVSEREATQFHLFAGAMCVLHFFLALDSSLNRRHRIGHLLVAALGGWYHAIGAKRHWRDRDSES